MMPTREVVKLALVEPLGMLAPWPSTRDVAKLALVGPVP